MKRYFTLICALILCCLTAVSARAQKVNHTTATKLPAILTTVDSVSSDILLSFAQTLLGVRYRAASSDPLRGFDCSGFVSYVFKKFNFVVPRSSNEFANAGEKIKLEDAKPGDVILFTGTKTHHPHSIGHVGIVFSNEDGQLKFIHSTSGKEHGVTISAMEDTYKRRFVEVVRLLKQNISQL
jgi:cell wall-associated NlpC family hydrolase